MSVQTTDARFAAETICEVASEKWKPGSFEFDALTVARAYLQWQKDCVNREALNEVVDHAKAAIARAEAAEAQAAALLVALKRFGRHEHDCEWMAVYQKPIPGHVNCTCGLSAALEPRK